MTQTREATSKARGQAATDSHHRLARDMLSIRMMENDGDSYELSRWQIGVRDRPYRGLDMKRHSQVAPF